MLSPICLSPERAPSVCQCKKFTGVFRPFLMTTMVSLRNCSPDTGFNVPSPGDVEGRIRDLLISSPERYHCATVTSVCLCICLSVAPLPRRKYFDETYHKSSWEKLEKSIFVFFGILLQWRQSGFLEGFQCGTLTSWVFCKISSKWQNFFLDEMLSMEMQNSIFG